MARPGRRLQLVSPKSTNTVTACSGSPCTSSAIRCRCSWRSFECRPASSSSATYAFPCFLVGVHRFAISSRRVVWQRAGAVVNRLDPGSHCRNPVRRHHEIRDRGCAPLLQAPSARPAPLRRYRRPHVRLGPTRPGLLLRRESHSFGWCLRAAMLTALAAAARPAPRAGRRLPRPCQLLGNGIPRSSSRTSICAASISRPSRRCAQPCGRTAKSLRWSRT